MFRDAGEFAFVPALEAAFEQVLAEFEALTASDLTASPDSLTNVDGVHDERGWRWYALHDAGEFRADRTRFPRTRQALASVPGLVNAGFSVLCPGTHLYPHRGELSGVLRCHLALRVPAGDVALRGGGETRGWRTGRCLVFDDTFEHEAWNHDDGDRAVLLVTFAP